MLEKIKMEGSKTNATKLCFIAHELEYLGYWISWDGIQLLAAKVEAIKNGQSFIGMINYKRDIWKF